MQIWGVGMMFWLLALPAWADVAIPAASLFLGGLQFAWPLLLVVVLLEAVILWAVWGRKLTFSFLRVLGQVSLINFLTTLVGLLVLLFGEVLSFGSDFLPFVLHFGVTLVLEALLLKRYYGHRETQSLTQPATIWKASLAINLPSYAILFLIVLIGGEMHQRSRPPQVKATMHTLQTMAETYAVDWGGEYPADLNALEQEARHSSNPYWKDAYDDQGELAYLKAGEAPRPYTAEYLPVRDPQTGKHLVYFIYGYGREAQPVMDKNQRFFLSNS